eukprot:TRINITY_DN64962_c0_g1_i1.p1 TRINITY_DN64962_c0_g1~~TRINITY_DN64962_c0_g1_i1.p1  ORF type:complete len:347 (-),score=73.33 TRINITY_DN64962_c0_g1_i1:22-1062(-)
MYCRISRGTAMTHSIMGSARRSHWSSSHSSRKGIVQMALACSIGLAVCRMTALLGLQFCGLPLQHTGRVARAAAVSEYIKGVGLTTGEQITVSLQPGPLGLELDIPTGKVEGVMEGAGKAAGMQSGWVIRTLDGQPYELLTLKAKIAGDKAYEVICDVLKPNPTAVFNTNMGTMKAEIFLDRAPRTASNFIDLVQSGFYDGIHFHRVIPEFMIQFGCPNAKDPSSDSAGKGGPEDGTFKNLATGGIEKRFRGGNIEDEFVSEDSNDPGTIGMANTGEPNTGGSQIYFNVNRNDFLDWFTDGQSRHPVFGRITEGYGVAVKISEVQRNGRDRPVEPIMMKSITLDGL